MRTLLVIALLAGTTPPALAGQQPAPRDETPERFVGRVYSRYRHDGAGVSTDRPGGTPYYTAALLDAFAKDAEAAQGEVGAIDADPLCGCQDHGDLRVTRVSIVKGEADTAKAQVVFVNLKERGAVTLTLSRTRDGWRIADVADGTMKSLAALLQDAVARPVQEHPASADVPSPPKP